ncbi:hypothetical protein [Acetobacterium wieringae]|uniref:hypothetical protein n=1 Tax=Acetobacterium wieringae TaxID=52694 RepID=UPI002033DEBC|nr:hypothetical protein [Acetobacterium wieringae]URN85679.1 hypothetical protein CHL1_001348 [Acetobacterium wieringae]
MNQLTLNNTFTLSDLEKTMTKVAQYINPAQLKYVFEQPQKTCLKFLKSIWSDINIENHCNLTSIDFSQVHKSADIEIPETLDKQCRVCLNTSKNKLSTYEQLFLSNYNLAMNDFADDTIKGTYSGYNHYL